MKRWLQLALPALTACGPGPSSATLTLRSGPGSPEVDTLDALTLEWQRCDGVDERRLGTVPGVVLNLEVTAAERAWVMAWVYGTVGDAVVTEACTDWVRFGPGAALNLRLAPPTGACPPATTPCES